jgi:hypothetical protein
MLFAASQLPLTGTDADGSPRLCFPGAHQEQAGRNRSVSVSISLTPDTTPAALA